MRVRARTVNGFNITEINFSPFYQHFLALPFTDNFVIGIFIYNVYMHALRNVGNQQKLVEKVDTTILSKDNFCALGFPMHVSF